MRKFLIQLLIHTTHKAIRSQLANSQLFYLRITTSNVLDPHNASSEEEFTIITQNSYCLCICNPYQLVS